MIKSTILSLGFFWLVIIGHLAAQDKFEAYTQQINGTTLSFDLVAIKGGAYKMGKNGGKQDEKPLHTVTLSPFWISTLEVSWDIFEPYMAKDLEKNKSVDGTIPSGVDAVTRPTKPYLDMTFGMGKAGYPAVAMTHYNAIQFCKWLYLRTGVFYRLPTEAEWEYVAKEGMNDDFFSKIDDYTWFEENSESKTQKVGNKLPNNFGVYDILGNVAEWTYDQYDPEFYAKSENNNPINVPSKLYSHVIRGGSYLSSKDELSPSARDYSDPEWKQLDPQIPKSNWWFPEAPFVGIRLVRPLETPNKQDIMAYYDKAPIKDF